MAFDLPAFRKISRNSAVQQSTSQRERGTPPNDCSRLTHPYVIIIYILYSPFFKKQHSHTRNSTNTYPKWWNLKKCISGSRNVWPFLGVCGPPHVFPKPQTSCFPQNHPSVFDIQGAHPKPIFDANRYLWRLHQDGPDEEDRPVPSKVGHQVEL